MSIFMFEIEVSYTLCEDSDPFEGFCSVIFLIYVVCKWSYKVCYMS